MLFTVDTQVTDLDLFSLEKDFSDFSEAGPDTPNDT